MDPATVITTAIIAGIAAGGTKAAQQAISDAYQGLKSLIRSKFGNESRVARAVDDVEAEPDSKAYQAVLQEQVEKARLMDDAEIRTFAEALLEKIRQAPAGQQRIDMVAKGIGIAQAASGGTATVSGVHVNQPRHEQD
jgi:hypothetical protein